VWRNTHRLYQCAYLYSERGSVEAKNWARLYSLTNLLLDIRLEMAEILIIYEDGPPSIEPLERSRGMSH